MHRLLARVRLQILGRGLPRLLRPRPPAPLVRLGSAYGGWWVPGDLLRPGTVAYCAGAGDDITFDQALLEHGCEVVTFDPTPFAIEAVRNANITDERFTFVEVGWWSETTRLKFYGLAEPGRHGSHSAVIARGSGYFEADVKPVHVLQRELGHDRIDIIKMDIEGAEYEVIDSLLRHGPLPQVLCMEFDQPQPVRKMLATTRDLKRAGYTLANVEFLNYTFIRP